jgi:hypothetical protein
MIDLLCDDLAAIGRKADASCVTSFNEILAEVWGKMWGSRQQRIEFCLQNRWIRRYLGFLPLIQPDGGKWPVENPSDAAVIQEAKAIVAEPQPPASRPEFRRRQRVDGAQRPAQFPFGGGMW